MAIVPLFLSVDTLNFITVVVCFDIAVYVMVSVCIFLAIHVLLQHCSLVGEFQDNMNVEHEPWSKLRDGSISCVPRTSGEYKAPSPSVMVPAHAVFLCMTCLWSELTSHLITFCSPVTLVYNCVCIFLPIHILLQPDCSLVGIHSRMHSCLLCRSKSDENVHPIVQSTE